VGWNFLRVTGAALALSAVAFDAQAQNLDAGKSPGQLFSANCSACHRGVKGLSKSSNVGQVAGFLRQHYTTNKEMAGSLAGYVVSAGVDPSGRRAREAAQDAAKPDPRAQRQAARTQEPTAAEAARAEPLTREERAAARRAALEAAAKREERAARLRAAQETAPGDPEPVQISVEPVALTHERASSRADTTRSFPRGTAAAEKPAPEKPAAHTAALPVARAPVAMPSAAPAALSVQPESTPAPAMQAAPDQPAAADEAAPPHPAESAATASVQPFAAPLP
jgi:hypothetical protein